MTWFAYNSGAVANGARHRISPELVYFYRSLGFAAQYYHQDQKLQASSTKPIVNVPIDGYYILATYLLTGEQRHRIQPADRALPSLRPHRADGLAGGLGTGIPRRRVGSGQAGFQRRNAAGQQHGHRQSIEQ